MTWLAAATCLRGNARPCTCCVQCVFGAWNADVALCVLCRYSACFAFTEEEERAFPNITVALANNVRLTFGSDLYLVHPPLGSSAPPTHKCLGIQGVRQCSIGLWLQSVCWCSCSHTLSDTVCGCGVWGRCRTRNTSSWATLCKR